MVAERHMSLARLLVTAKEFICPSPLDSSTRRYDLVSVPSQETTILTEMSAGWHVNAFLFDPGIAMQLLSAAAYEGCGLLSTEDRRSTIAISAPPGMTRLRVSTPTSRLNVATPGIYDASWIASLHLPLASTHWAHTRARCFLIPIAGCRAKPNNTRGENNWGVWPSDCDREER